MSSIAYTLTLADGTVVHTDPEETDVYLGHCPTDLELQDAALRAFASTTVGEGSIRVTASGRKRLLAVRHLMIVDAEVER